MRDHGQDYRDLFWLHRRDRGLHLLLSPEEKEFTVGQFMGFVLGIIALGYWGLIAMLTEPLK